MPKFKIANKVYDISADQVNKFKALAQTKGYKIEEVLEQQPIEVGQPEGKPQAVAKMGAPATAQKAAPAMDSKLDVGSLDLLPKEISFKDEEVKSLKEMNKITEACKTFSFFKENYKDDKFTNDPDDIISKMSCEN